MTDRSNSRRATVGTYLGNQPQLEQLVLYRIRSNSLAGPLTLSKVQPAENIGGTALLARP
jgi:hypothetical protein